MRSIAFLILASATNLSVGSLLVGGFVAGGLLALALGIGIYITSRGERPARTRASGGERVRAFIGSLPPIVMILVYLSTPGYISLLWTHPTGQLMLVGCVIWMSIGIMVMKKMINFDF